MFSSGSLKAIASPRKQALFAMLLSIIMLPAISFSVASADSKSLVIARGEDILKVLVGNTLRSIGRQSIPDYRYFMNERFDELHGLVKTHQL